MKINFEKLTTPQYIFFIYVIAASALIMVFRFILPGSEPPLEIFARNWRIIQGLLEVFNFFPALALSALILPFGLSAFEENYQSFSEIFFKRLIVSVVLAICAAVIYGLVYFLVLPTVKNNEENMRFEGEVYQLAKTYAQERGAEGNWQEASQFLAICDVIWPNSPSLEGLRTDIEVNLQKAQATESREESQARAALSRDWRGADVSALPGSQQPVDATQAITLGRTAFNETRYYDAHWLATLAGRLAIPGSPEAATAARLASEAWNMIASQAPNRMETRLYQLYNLKLSGYQAMQSSDWIRAFYIFQELLSLTPDDPDAANFYAASELGAKEYAFFIDEMELSLGTIQTGALFSLPAAGQTSSQNGRAVLRFSSLTTSADVSYGMGVEYMAFDANSVPTASVRSRYAKLLPVTLDEKEHVLILMHALDRYDQNNSYDSEWLLGAKIPGGIILNVSYEDLLLFSHIRRGLPNLQIDELFLASGKVEAAGYVYQIFDAEILNRIGTVIFLLPMAVIVIVLGWRYRVKAKPRYVFILMLPVLPVVFHGFVFLYRSVFNTLGIWLVLSIGFTAALVVYIFVAAVIMLVSLIVLAAQHS
uniref:Uncharacterized protein n=1 Tax=uncultured bacterium contig00066 TaxID=1181548 RepID=A0A806KGA2_9BACT|nr:hypothetical protein [uncultured bacterium contig00066]